MLADRYCLGLGGVVDDQASIPTFCDRTAALSALPGPYAVGNDGAHQGRAPADLSMRELRYDPNRRDCRRSHDVRFGRLAGWRVEAAHLVEKPFEGLPKRWRLGTLLGLRHRLRRAPYFAVE